MALRHIDSYDHYDHTLLKYNDGEYGDTGTDGRRTTKSNNNNSGILYFENQPTWICGAAFKWYVTMEINFFFKLIDGITNDEQIRVTTTADGNIKVVRGGGVELGRTVGLALQLEQYYYIEFKCTIDNAGSYEVRVNGVNVLSGSADTQYTANASASIVQTKGGYSVRVDDLYICDGTGGVNDDFLGDRKATAVMPNAAGSNSGWTGSAGGDHYTLVDENPATGDTDYVETLTPGAKESYFFQPITDTGGIAGIQLSLLIRKTDATSRTCRHIVKIGGTTYNGANFTCNDTYTYAKHVWDKNPDTGLAWTKDDVNGAEFGVEFIS